LERAQDAHPGFRLTAHNTASVTAICRQLDGLPLALELAAARANVLAPEQILSRLDDRFQLLVDRHRSGPARHRTLEAAIEWSYELLSKSERRLLQRLSVFQGGCNIETLEALADSDDMGSGEVLELLSALVRKSLVVARDTDESEMRYSLLDSVRQFGLQRLVASGEADDVRKRHAQFYAAMAEQAAYESEGQSARLWINRFEAEYANIEAAWRWSVDRNQRELQLRLAAEAWQPQWMAGHIREPLRKLEVTLAVPSVSPSAVHALALHGAGLLSMVVRDVRFDGAAEYFVQSAHEFRAVGDKRGLVLALGHAGLAMTAMGDMARGESLLGQASEVAAASADTLAIGYALFSAGQAALLRGDDSDAVGLLEQAVAAGRRARAPRLTAHALCNLMCAVATAGPTDRLDTLARSSLTTMLDVGDAWALMAAVMCVAIAAQRRGLAERAVALFSAADALRDSMGATALKAVQQVAARSVSALRESLSHRAFERAWRRGQGMTTQRTIELALKLDHNREGMLPRKQITGAPHCPSHPSGCSPGLDSESVRRMTI
jgi:hypothetical protein